MRTRKKIRRKRGGRVFDCKRTHRFLPVPKYEYGFVPGPLSDSMARYAAKRTMMKDIRRVESKIAKDITKTRSLERYCEKKDWYDGNGAWIKSNGDCGNILLPNLYEDIGFKQFVLGRMMSIEMSNYYNCQSKFRTLAVENWTMDMNDLFIYCAGVEGWKVNFPIRCVEKKEPVRGQPAPLEPPGAQGSTILSQEYEEGSEESKSVARLSGPRLDRDYYDISPATAQAGFTDTTMWFGSPTGSLFNREMCQLLRMGVRVWRCYTSPYTNISFISFKEELEGIDIQNDSFTLADETGVYGFTNVTKMLLHSDNLNSQRELLERSKKNPKRVQLSPIVAVSRSKQNTRSKRAKYETSNGRVPRSMYTGTMSGRGTKI